MSEIKLHIFIVAWGTLEIVLFGGVIFGWPSLVYVFKQNGIFMDLCTDENNTDIFLVSNLADNGTYKAVNTINTTLSAVNNFTSFVDKYDQPISYSQRCPEQDQYFNLIYVLAAVINGVASFPNGALLDKYGTRVLRIIGAATFIPGVLMAAFVTNDSALLLFPAMILIVYGGYLVLMTNFQLGNLLPNMKSMIISLYCGAYDSSAFMLVLIKWAYTAGLAPKYSFIIMLCLYIIYIVSTFWFMPRKIIPFPLPQGYKINLNCCKVKSSKKQTVELEQPKEVIDHDNKEIDQTVPFIEKNTDEIDSKLKQSLKEESKMVSSSSKDLESSFMKEALSLLFLSDVIWLTLMRFQSWSFVGRLNPALERLADGNQAVVSQYTSVYASLQFFGIILAPLSGRLMDRKKNRDVDPALKRIEMIEVCIASFVIDNTFGLLLAITMTIPNLKVQYASFVFHVIHRALLYGPNSAFIAQAFNAKNFGKLFGLAMTVAAAVSLFQFPLFILVQGPLNGDPLMFNILILVLMVLAYGHPIYLYYWCRKNRKIYNENKRNMETK